MSTTTAVAPQKRSTRHGIALALVLSVQLMLILDATVVNVALPEIRGSLGFTPAGLSWVLNAYTLAFGGLLLFGGRLGDVLGRRRTFVVGLTMFTIGSALGGLAQSSTMLVAARTLQGAGAAIAAPSVLALITTSARDDGERNRGLALFSAVSSAGGSVGLLLGGALTEGASWRWSLFINVPIGIAVLALSGRFIDETPRQPGRFDVVGAGTAVFGSVALVYGFINAAEDGWASFETIASFLLSAVLLASFVVTEARTRQPLLELSLVRNRQRAGALLTMAFVVGSMFALFFLAVQYMQYVLGMNALESGIGFLPLTILIFVMSRISPRLVSRYGSRPLAVIGALLIATAHFWLSSLSASDSFWTGMLGPLMVAGLGAGLMFMPLTVAILAQVPPNHAGTASGLLQTAQQVGGSLGLAVLVSVYAAAGVPGEIVPGLEETFTVATGMAVIGAALAFVTIQRTGSRAAARSGEVAVDA